MEMFALILLSYLVVWVLLDEKRFCRWEIADLAM